MLVQRIDRIGMTPGQYKDVARKLSNRNRSHSALEEKTVNITLRTALYVATSFCVLTNAAIASVPDQANVSASKHISDAEQEMSEKLASMRSKSLEFVLEDIEGRLYVNGSQLIDPEGQIQTYAYDRETGDIIYTIRTGQSDAIIRASSAKDANSAVTVGNLYRRPNGEYEFESQTGVRAVGRRFTISGNKIVLSRTDAVLVYEPGQGLQTYSLPQGTYPAFYQRGNIAQTNTILIRLAEGGDDGRQLTKAAGEFFNLISGKQQAKEFALYDFTKNTFLPVDLQNSFQQHETLSYDDSFMPTGHYFWSVEWLKIRNRRIAIHFADINGKIFVSDLDTGETKLAMSRGLGISSFKTVRNPDDTVALSANWMFKDHVIPDIVDWFDNDGIAITTKKKK